MTTDRLQAAWRYVGAELWRPLFAQFGHAHPDLPVEIVRTLLVRPRGMAQIFVEAGRYPTLDALHADAATSLDSVADARAALRRIKPEFFIDGRAIAILLADIAVALEEYGNHDLEEAYRTRLEQFVRRHALPYRIDVVPVRLLPTLGLSLSPGKKKVSGHLSESNMTLECSLLMCIAITKAMKNDLLGNRYRGKHPRLGYSRH
ncbi:hypothetical protein V5F63_13325 [Xanthobacter autotrophicus DSM 597]|uniref:hypothetical protein n=1 Tax=Xanthobacter wiegelii TaxID=3119913 RepID=UPI0037275DBF